MLSESPTNITVFPRHVLRKSAPSNLCSHAERVSELSSDRALCTWAACDDPPGQPAVGGAPPELEVGVVGAAVAAAVEDVRHERAGGRVVQRVRLVRHPPPPEQVAASKSRSRRAVAAHQQVRSSSRYDDDDRQHPGMADRHV